MVLKLQPAAEVARQPLSSPARRCRPELKEPGHTMDILYLAVTVGLLSLSWGLVRLCDRV